MEILWSVLYSFAGAVIALVAVLATPLLNYSTSLDKFRFEQRVKVYENLLKILDAEKFDKDEFNTIKSELQLHASTPVLKEIIEFMKQNEQSKKADTKQLKIEMLLDLNHSCISRWCYKRNKKYDTSIL